MNRKKKLLKITLISLAVLFVLFSAASFIFIKIAFNEMFGRSVQNEYGTGYRYQDIADRYDRELHSFYSGSNKLQGYLYGAENTDGLVVISHGLGGGADSYLAETMYFVDNGYSVFAYDNTGCYNSEGDNCVGLPQSAIDLDAALTYIENNERFDGLPILLYGHSWGGYAVTAGLKYDHNVTAAVSVAGFNDPMDMVKEWCKGMMGNFTYVEYPYIYLYERIILGDCIEATAVDGINSTDTPVLIIQGDNDETVNYSGAATIACRDEITNPNAQFKICGDDRHNGHNNLFISDGAYEYSSEKRNEYDKLSEEYGDEIPEDVEREFFSGIDKDKYNELDEDFMSDVISFYRHALDSLS